MPCLARQGCICPAGGFQEALTALLGREAPGLSASTISRLKAAWQEEHARQGAIYRTDAMQVPVNVGNSPLTLMREAGSAETK